MSHFPRSVCLSVCLSVYCAHGWGLQKRMNWSRCSLGRGQTQVCPRNIESTISESTAIDSMYRKFSEVGHVVFDLNVRIYLQIRLCWPLCAFINCINLLTYLETDTFTTMHSTVLVYTAGICFCATTGCPWTNRTAAFDAPWNLRTPSRLPTTPRRWSAATCFTRRSTTTCGCPSAWGPNLPHSPGHSALPPAWPRSFLPWSPTACSSKPPTNRRSTRKRYLSARWRWLHSRSAAASSAAWSRTLSVIN